MRKAIFRISFLYLIYNQSLFGATEVMSHAASQRMLSVSRFWQSNDNVTAGFDEVALAQINKNKFFRIAVADNKEAYIRRVNVRCSDGSVYREKIGAYIPAEYFGIPKILGLKDKAKKDATMCIHPKGCNRFAFDVVIPDSCQLRSLEDIRVDGKTLATEGGAFIRAVSGIATIGILTLSLFSQVPYLVPMTSAGVFGVIAPSLSQAGIKIDILYPRDSYSHFQTPYRGW